MEVAVAYSLSVAYPLIAVIEFIQIGKRIPVGQFDLLCSLLFKLDVLIYFLYFIVMGVRHPVGRYQPVNAGGTVVGIVPEISSIRPEFIGQ